MENLFNKENSFNKNDSFHLSPESKKIIESRSEEIFINGVLIPEEFKNYQEIGIGFTSKKMQAGEERSRAARIMGEAQRFHNPASNTEMGRRIGAARMIKDVLNTIYPEAEKNNDLLRDVIKTQIVHGDNVAIVDEQFIEEMRLSLEQKSEKAQIKADACVTRLQNVPLLIPAADCPPIAFYDKAEKVIGLAHSGWRGTLKNISSKVIETMKSVYSSNPKNILIYLGPHARIGRALNNQDSYEVGREVYEQFATDSRPDGSQRFSPKEIESIFVPNIAKPDHYFFDQGKAIYYSLLAADIPKENIKISAYSTMVNNDLFVSERVEGREKRGTSFMMAVLKSSE